MERGIKANLVLIRIIFVLLLTAAAARMQPFALPALAAGAVGGLLGLAAIGVEMRARLLSGPQLLGAVCGISGGSLLGLVFVWALREHLHGGFLPIMIPLVAAYLGLSLGMAKAGLWQPDGRIGAAGESSGKLLDSSVLIDGRIADICEAHFMDGLLGVPQFVLRELQMVADSGDPLKRQRGRRGMEILQRMQKMKHVMVHILEDDATQEGEVDDKLIELARRTGGKIVTNDFNLNKVASLQGIAILNVNLLANAMKPAVLPGEPMRVLILREGKEPNQGVAYLDDGTMVVVDGARKMINKTIDISVTSVHQTTAGKMIFGRYDERGENFPRPIAAAAGEGPRAVQGEVPGPQPLSPGQGRPLPHQP